MLQLLYKYLILNKKVSLPGIGVFYITRHPSSLDFSKKQFTAPSAEIIFKENRNEADKKLFRFIGSNQQIDEQNAIQNLNLFSAGIKEKLESVGTVQLSGIGILTKSRVGTISFKQEQSLNTFYENVASERMMREVSSESSKPSIIEENYPGIAVEEAATDAENSRPKRDYWWLYAIIAASIAVAAIAYYYYQNGSLR